MEFAVGAENVYNDNMQVGAAIGARSGNRINFRGLPSGRQLKDGFPTYAPMDTYNLERMEISRGAGGISYGDTDATGTINTGSKRARFNNSYEVQARYDDRGSQRLTADLNRVLVDQKLALRFNLVDSDLEGWHENTARNMQGWAGAVRYQPFKHGNTVIDFTHESGRLLSFFSHTALVDLTTAYVRGSGTHAQDADPLRAGTQANGVGMLRLSGNSTLANANQAFIRGSLYNLSTQGTTAAFPVYRVSTLVQSAGATNTTDPQNPHRLPFLPTQNPLFPSSRIGPDPMRGSAMSTIPPTSPSSTVSRATPACGWLSIIKRNSPIRASRAMPTSGAPTPVASLSTSTATCPIPRSPTTPPARSPTPISSSFSSLAPSPAASRIAICGPLG